MTVFCFNIHSCDGKADFKPHVTWSFRNNSEYWFDFCIIIINVEHNYADSYFCGNHDQIISGFSNE